MAKKKARPKSKPNDESHVAADLPDREVMTLIDTPLIGGELLSGSTGATPLTAGAGTVDPAVTEGAQLTSGGVDTVSQTTADAASVASQQAQSVQDVAGEAPAQPYSPTQTSESRT